LAIDISAGALALAAKRPCDAPALRLWPPIGIEQRSLWI